MALYIQFSDDGRDIHKWSRRPFDGALKFERDRASATQDTVRENLCCTHGQSLGIPPPMCRAVKYEKF